MTDELLLDRAREARREARAQRITGRKRLNWFVLGCAIGAALANFAAKWLA
jgi:hypothetical protein